MEFDTNVFNYNIKLEFNLCNVKIKTLNVWHLILASTFKYIKNNTFKSSYNSKNKIKNVLRYFSSSFFYF